MAPITKTLKVIEKFRAPAAYYRPSSRPGGGWVFAAEPGMGGKAIIQLQEDAESAGENKEFIPVVRYQLRHGKDVMNARIQKGLPINRVNERTLDFKSASRNTSGVVLKTIFRFVFESSNDADEFRMWYLEKNGSIEAWIAKEKAAKLAKKRKGTDLTGCGLGPQKKKPKLTAFPEQTTGKKEGPKPLGDSTNRNSIETKRSKVKAKKMNGSKDDEREAKAEEEEVVILDYEDAPLSQNWMAAFK